MFDLSCTAVTAISVCPILALAAASFGAWAFTRRAVWAAHQIPAPARDGSRQRTS